MKARVSIVEETLTENLEELQQLIPQLRDEVIEETTDMVTDAILMVAPKKSGALQESGQDEYNQHFISTLEYAEMTIVYTGMEADYSWEEFREDGNRKEPPERDYAMYQETGDWSNAFKKPTTKPKHLHFVGYTMEHTAGDILINSLKEAMENLSKL